ncbi:hypothetical protein [Sphingomonas hankookensis]|uniref:hypothetical protein n=1 Tax=Sphingomonas hankookensis TaxID=563996 RepID=UPI003F7B008A
MFVSHSAFVSRFVELKGRVPAAEYSRIAREATERARPVAFRAQPLNFADLADRLETAVQPR